MLNTFKFVWRLRTITKVIWRNLFLCIPIRYGGTEWRSWLRHCTTRRKVAGLIPGGVNGIFHWHNPSGHTMALGLTQPLTEMSTRNTSWGVKTAGVQGLQSSCTDCLEIWGPQPLEPSRPVQGCNGIALPFYLSAIIPTLYKVTNKLCSPNTEKWNTAWIKLSST
jgi:hypothetical protein